MIRKRYLTDEEAKILNSVYIDKVRKRGPLPSEYSALPEEFFTTCGELFEGFHDPSDPLWLKENYGEVYELFCKITGRRPA